MKNKRKFKLFTFLSLVSLSAFSLGFGFVNQTNNNSISKVGTSNQALEDTTTTQNQNSTTYSVNNAPTSTNKYANEITEDELQSVLTPKDATVNFSVIILPVTENNLNNGSLDFLIYEKLNKGSSYQTDFAIAKNSNNEEKNGNGAQSDNTIDSQILNKYKDSNNQHPTQQNVFSTLKFPNLANWILKKQYSLKWKSNSDIENFIKNKQTPGLTVNDVWYNIVDNSSLPPLKQTSGKSISKRDATKTPETEIIIKQVDNLPGTQNKPLGDVGLYRVEVKLDNVVSQKDDNQNNNIDLVRFLGGFNTQSGTRQTFKLVGNSSLDNVTISKNDVFNSGDSTANSGTKLKELTASEFASPNGGTQELIKILTQNDGLNNSGQKILTLSYGNLSNIEFNKPDNTNTLTEDNGVITNPTVDQIQKSLKVTNINPVPNDSDGSLQLVVYYDVFDVYTGTIQNEVTTYSFPAGTFKVNPNANKDLFVNWKTSDSLENMNYSYEVVNEYYKNKDNKEFARIFSNRFLDTTDAVKAMDRTVDINYGKSNGTDSGGMLTASDDNTVKVTLTFQNWGSTGQSFTISNTFTLKGYRYGENSNGNTDDALTFNWKSNSTLFSENQQYSELTPSTVALDLVSKNDANNTLLYSKFILGDSTSNSLSRQVEISVKPDDIAGTMMVYVMKKDNNNSTVVKPNNHIYQQMFVGFKTANNSSDVTSFSFIPQSDVSNELLGIPLTSVTKEDVMNLYIKNIDLFKDKTLTEDNVEIIPVINDNGQSYLRVNVTIPLYNQSTPGITTQKQTFYTIITGFSTIIANNDTKFNPPKDLTAIISISSSVTICVCLGVTLIGLLTKRAGIKTYKKNNDLIGIKKEKSKKISK